MTCSRRVSEILLALGLAAAVTANAGAGSNCFTVVVGKLASADGCVLMGHNEDDAPPQIVHHRKVPRRQYRPGDTVRLRNGGELEQIETTWAYIWSEMPGMDFSDAYLNEWGVCIASDACRSREDRPELTDGGIGYMLRRLVAERATTAREGVILAGRLLERFGYDASGRTYTICDPDEGWLFSAVSGKRWAARRVPDDEVAVIANTYTIHGIDLSDTANFLAAADVIDYAVSRGWYDPSADGTFDFAAVYAHPEVAADSANICRQWRGLQLVAPDAVLSGSNLPFSVKPRRKLDAAAVMAVLRDHYEDSDRYAVSPTDGCPHKTGIRSICTWTTQTSFVARLRGDLPADIGLVYWLCLAAPCTSFYIPFYFGMADFPPGYRPEEGRPSGDFFTRTITAPFEADSHRAFWTSSNFSDKVASDYRNLIATVTAERENLESGALARQKALELAAGELYPLDRDAAVQLLADYSNDIYLTVMETLQRVLTK